MAKGLLFTRLHDYQRIMSQSNLDNVFGARGLYGVVRALMSVADNSTAYVNATASFLGLSPMSLVADLDASTGMMARVSKQRAGAVVAAWKQSVLTLGGFVGVP